MDTKSDDLHKGKRKGSFVFGGSTGSLFFFLAVHAVCLSFSGTWLGLYLCCGGYWNEVGLGVA